ncbi:hypothetical protein EDC01DRAFT_726324 [Geopyxis carbonaria]|nr:hypothetical protein EDC01DRAFT_726324 [Geopyxis carbonaria]
MGKNWRRRTRWWIARNGPPPYDPETEEHDALSCHLCGCPLKQSHIARSATDATDWQLGWRREVATDGQVCWRRDEGDLPIRIWDEFRCCRFYDGAVLRPEMVTWLDSLSLFLNKPPVGHRWRPDAIWEGESRLLTGIRAELYGNTAAPAPYVDNLWHAGGHPLKLRHGHSWSSHNWIKPYQIPLHTHCGSLLKRCATPLRASDADAIYALLATRFHASERLWNNNDYYGRISKFWKDGWISERNHEHIVADPIAVPGLHAWYAHFVAVHRRRDTAIWRVRRQHSDPFVHAANATPPARPVCDRGTTGLSRLPVELRMAVVDALTLPELAALRSASRAFASLELEPGFWRARVLNPGRDVRWLWDVELADLAATGVDERYVDWRGAMGALVTAQPGQALRPAGAAEIPKRQLRRVKEPLGLRNRRRIWRLAEEAMEEAREMVDAIGEGSDGEWEPVEEESTPEGEVLRDWLVSRKDLSNV